MKFIILLVLVLSGQTTTQSNQPSIINRGNGAEPDSLNIHSAQGLNSQNILMDMYEGLMTFSPRGKPEYGVALSHTVNPDFTLWQFTLKPNAKWSDGSPVLANDFIHAWKKAAAPATAAPYRHLFDNMTDQGALQISSDHSHHLRIQLNQSDAGLLHKLVLPIFYPMHQNQSTKISTTTQSNGAYQLNKWDIQERIVLSKNPHFHSAHHVLTDEIHYWVTENQNSELLRFRANELDITETIPDNKIDWLKINLAQELRISPYYGTFFLGLNLNHPKLSNPDLRHALSLTIDRQILVDKVLKTGQIPAQTIIPPELTTSKTPVNNHDLKLELAKQFLIKSTFNPKTDQLELLYNNSNNQKKVALAVAAMWRQNLGIRTKLKNQEWKVFVNTRRSNQKQVFRSGWIADFHDPLNFLNLFHSQSHFNFYGFENHEYDQTIRQLQSNLDHAERLLLINHAENLIQEHTPVIPLYHYVSRHLVKQNVKGYTDNEMDRHLSRYLYLDSK